MVKPQILIESDVPSSRNTFVTGFTNYMHPRRLNWICQFASATFNNGTARNCRSTCCRNLAFDYDVKIKWNSKLSGKFVSMAITCLQHHLKKLLSSLLYSKRKIVFSGLIQLTCNNAITFSVAGTLKHCIDYCNRGSLSTTKLNHISL